MMDGLPLTVLLKNSCDIKGGKGVSYSQSNSVSSCVGCVSVYAQIRQKPETLAQNRRNRTVRFSESDTPILPRLTAVRGTIRLR
jgi:hypothetical protein